MILGKFASRPLAWTSRLHGRQTHVEAPIRLVAAPQPITASALRLLQAPAVLDCGPAFSSCHPPALVEAGSAPFAPLHAEGSDGADDHHHGGHEDHYDPPGGWLWGVRPGEKYEKEGWEGIVTWLYIVPIVVATIFYVNKEDTTIQTWALEEARRRLEKEGLLTDPFPKGVPNPHSK
ncbi:hypothetical protein DV737_g1823, partial [Chaetothyriales sp. CBS 132003]